jgi:hypothetical protein
MMGSAGRNEKGGAKMIARLVHIISLGILLVAWSCAIADTGMKEAAKASALAWLQLVDEENYADSWDDAAEYFKNAVEKKTWVQMLGTVRTPLGKLLSRVPKGMTYRTSLPGAPDGQYVIIQFNTSFENKKSAIETVTPMLDADGKWRVSGYYIK